jgi:hypothetical protein
LVEILADALVRIGPATNSNEAVWTSDGSLMESPANGQLTMLEPQHPTTRFCRGATAAAP